MEDFCFNREEINYEHIRTKIVYYMYKPLIRKNIIIKRYSHYATFDVRTYFFHPRLQAIEMRTTDARKIDPCFVRSIYRSENVVFIESAMRPDCCSAAVAERWNSSRSRQKKRLGMRYARYERRKSLGQSSRQIFIAFTLPSDSGIRSLSSKESPFARRDDAPSDQPISDYVFYFLLDN